MALLPVVSTIPACWLLCERHVNAQRRSQINFVLLFLHNDRPQRLAQRKFPHRLGLPDTLAIAAHCFAFVLQIRAQHGDRII